MNYALSAILALCLATAVSATTTPVETIIEQQRNAATPRTQFIPFYSISGADKSDLYLVSKITDPLLIDVFVTSPNGEQLYTGRETLPPSRNLRIDLRERLANAGPSFASGNVRLEFVGDAGALQAWAVVRGGGQTFEVPFIAADKIAVTELLSYWDAAATGPRPGVSIRYQITNTSNSRVAYTLALSRGTRVTRTHKGILAPLETKTHVVSDAENTRHGWLRLTHDGAPGAVIGAGVVTASEVTLGYVPVVTRNNLERGPVFETLHLPQTGINASARTHLTLFNPSEASQSVTIEALAQSTGAVIVQATEAINAWEVETVHLEQLFGRGVADARLRVRGTSAALAVDGAAVSPNGEVVDISIHPASTAHKSGTYPIPDLQTHSVRTTIVNLGQEESEIVAQYFWDGGTYAVPLLRIPAGGTAIIDPSSLAAAKRKDLLDRSMNTAGRNISLKWSVRRGSKTLIGRTEATPRGGSDAFGFNCGGCCWSIPGGGIVPGEVEVGLGEYPNFTAIVYYDTCSGRLGPWETFGTYQSVPWPFSWDYAYVSTSDGAEEDISWEGYEEQTNYFCVVTQEPVGGSGRAKACDKVNNPQGYNEQQTCSQQTNGCTSCLGCCDALYLAKVCKGYNQIIAQSERNACRGTCNADYCFG